MLQVTVGVRPVWRNKHAVMDAALLMLVLEQGTQHGRWEISDVDTFWWIECVWLGARWNALIMKEHLGKVNSIKTEMFHYPLSHLFLLPT